MSDQSQGPGWWLASDGRWYPPDQAPAVPPADTWAESLSTPPPGPPPPTGMSGGVKALIAALVVVGLLIVVGLGALLLGGDADSSSDTDSESPETTTDGEAAVDLPAGYHVVEGDGVSIGVPDGWQGISPEDAALSEAEFEQAFPDLSDEMLERGAAAVNQGSVLVAFDVESGSLDNVNIIEIPTRIELSLMEQQAETELAALGAEVDSIEEAPVPAGDALRAEYTVDVALPDGGTVPAHGVQYYVVTEDRTYVVTFSSATDVGDVATKMMDTFRVS